MKRSRNRNRDRQTQPVTKTQIIKPRTKNQADYFRAIRTNEITFCIGPAGSGKSLIACAIAAEMYLANEIDKIILCRPAVEAEDEKIGYLPGDINEKMDPFVRPLYDCLAQALGGMGKVKQLIRENIIEIIPLCYIRGRTLKNCVTILDEAQNTTPAQMKMFLTRMGDGAKIIVNGDITQHDMKEIKSGLTDAYERIYDIKGIAWIEMNETDIVRHKMVRKILECYED